MLRKIPFNSNLISIGNSPHYDGQLVYSDGRVAYGWQYNVQQPITGINRATAGLWVRAEHSVEYGNTFWCLMDENLNFENVPFRGMPEPSDNVYNYYCYPWACCTWDDWSEDIVEQGEMIYSDDVHYRFQGNVIYMEPGKVLTYYSEYDDYLGEYTHYWLCSYDTDGSVIKTDLMPLYDYDNDFYMINYYKLYAGEYEPGEDPPPSTTITALSTEGGYVTIRNPDPDADVPYTHYYCANGTCIESPFPSQKILSNKAKILLPSLDLIVNGVTYTNDYLQLLSGSSSYWWNGAKVNGVHAYEDIVISQFSNDGYGYGYMFKNGTLYNHYSFYDREEGTGVTIGPIYCWSLAEIPGGQWYISYNPYE